MGLLEARYVREAAEDGRLIVLADGWDIDLALVYRADRADEPTVAALRAALALAWSVADGETAPA